MSHEPDRGGHMNMNMTPSGSMSNGSMYMNDMMMHMTFYWGKDAIVLFSGWPDQKLGMYVLALFFVFSLALTNEVLSFLPLVKPGTTPIVGGLILAGVYALRIGSAYLVMLSVMSFNIGIFIAAVAGHTVGFFIMKSWELATKRGETLYSTATTPKA